MCPLMEKGRERVIVLKSSSLHRLPTIQCSSWVSTTTGMRREDLSKDEKPLNSPREIVQGIFTRDLEEVRLGKALLFESF